MSLRKSRAIILLLAGAWSLAAGNLPLPGSGRVAIEFNRSVMNSVIVVGLAGPAGAGIAPDPAGVLLRSCPLPAAAASLLQSAPFGAGVVPLFSTAGAQTACRVVLTSNASTGGVQEFAAGAQLTLVYCSMSSASASSCDLGTSVGSPTSYLESSTAVLPVDFPNRMLRWQLDDRTSTADAVGDNDDLVLTIRQETAGGSSPTLPMDFDGDGLWDDWETVGADFDGDGTVDLRLSSEGADLRTRDIFLYIDYMDCAVAGGDCVSPSDHSHRPKANAITWVIRPFQGTDPSGFYGLGTSPPLGPINVHVEIATAGLRHQRVAALTACGPLPSGAADFDVIKAAAFGANFKRFTHRYVLFGHGQQVSGGATGCAETPGNDILVTLGNMGGSAGDLDGDGATDDNRTGTIAQQAGTLLHELGHTLGLRHGGADSINYKPNYLSVMNYSFQLSGIPKDGPITRADFSGIELPPLRETATINSNGFNRSGFDMTRHICPDFAARVEVLGGGTDWGCTGAPIVPVSNVDINGDRECVKPGPDGIRQTPPAGDDVLYLGAFIHDGPDRTCQSQAVGDDIQMRPVGSVQPHTLNGYDDWRNLRLDHFSTAAYPDGQHAGVESGQELEVETYLASLAPDPRVALSAAPAGPSVVFTARLTNSSADTATGVQTTVTIPAPFTAGACTVASGTGTCTSSGNTAQISLPELTGGAAATVTVQATASCTGSDATLFTATASLTSLTPDINLTNNSASLSYPRCVAQPYSIAVTYGAPRRSPTTGLYAQPVTIRNTGLQTATGPLSLALTNLNPAVTLVGASSTVYATPAGRPFVNLAAASLAPGASTTVILSFQNTGNIAYGFTAQLLGPGAR